MASGGYEREETGSDDLLKGSEEIEEGSEDHEELKCTPCHEDGNIRDAVGLCIDCNEYLCQRCYDGHTVPSPFKNHQVVDKQNMPRSEVLLRRRDRCTETCQQHDGEVIEYYCTGHSQLGCSVCLNIDHRNCQGVLYIPDVAKDFSENEFILMESQFMSCLENSKRISDGVEQYAETIKNSCTDALTMIQTLRKDFNDVLDTIERDLADTATGMKTSKLDQLLEITDKCKSVQTEIQSILANIGALQTSKRLCQLFVEMMKLKDTLRLLGYQVSGSHRELSAAKCEIKFTANQEVLNTLKRSEASETFGHITGTNPAQNPEAQATPDQTEEIARQHVTDKHTIVNDAFTHDNGNGIFVKTYIDDSDCCITGSVVLPDNTLIITDNTNRTVKAVNIGQSTITRQLKLSSHPWDIAMISDNLVAITLPNEKKVIFMHTSGEFSVGKTLLVGGHARGIDYMNGKLAVSFCWPDQIKVLDMQGTVLHTLRTDTQGQEIFDSPFYLSFGLDGSTLYVSNYYGNNVVRIQPDGVIATYTECMRYPTKTMVDGSGALYICAQGACSIYKLMSENDEMKELLEVDDGARPLSDMSWPYTFSYSETENKLYVGCYRKNLIRVYTPL